MRPFSSFSTQSHFLLALTFPFFSFFFFSGTYYSDYYSNYYADYYAQAVRNVDAIKYGENMNQLESEERSLPKNLPEGQVMGSTVGSLGSIIDQ